MKVKEGYLGLLEDEKRNLYLYYSGASELVAENLTLNEALQRMNDYLDKVNFKTYYTRAWDGSDETTRRMILDFGSHFKFFHWATAPEGELVAERAFHGTPSRTLEPRPTYETLKRIAELDKDDSIYLNRSERREI